MISALAQLMQTMKRLDLPTRQEKEEFLLHIEAAMEVLERIPGLRSHQA
ncbi:hypothetical protein GBAR_LOCUS16, partial [Geodia barretti]